MRLAVGMTLALLSGCGGDDSTQVVLIVEADARTRQLASELHVVVHDNENQVVRDETNSFNGTARIPLVPRDGDASRRYRVVIEALSEEEIIVSRAEVQGGYSEAEKVERSVPLRETCLFQLCGPGLTCVESGRCAPACEAAECVDNPRISAVFVNNATGSDGNDCSEESTPCATVDAAVTQLSGPEKRIYLIAAEPYDPITIDSSLSGTAGAPTVIQSWGDLRASIRSGGSSESPVRVQDTNDVLISGFQINGTIQYGIEVRNSERITISGNVLENDTYSSSANDPAGIHINDDASDVTISGNRVVGQRSSSLGQCPAIAAPARATRVVGNDLSENQSFGLLSYNEGGFVAAYNRFYDNGFDGAGVYVGDSSSGVVFSNNWFCANTQGVSANQNIGNVLLKNNSFFNNQQNGLQIYDSGVRGEAIANLNLFVENGGAIVVDAGTVRGSNNAFVDDATAGNFVSDAPDTNIDVTPPQFEDAANCLLNAPDLPRAIDGSRIGAL